jgi:hypothetical protein
LFGWLVTHGWCCAGFWLVADKSNEQGDCFVLFCEICTGTHFSNFQLIIGRTIARGHIKAIH